LGYSHFAALTEQGHPRTVGTSSSGELALGHKLNVDGYFIIPNITFDSVSCAELFTIAMKGNTAWSWGLNSCGQLGLGDHKKRLVPTPIETHKFKSAIARGSRVIGIDEDNNALSWGLNRCGQLGLGLRTDLDNILEPTPIPNHKFSKIYCGANHTFGADLEQNVWVWGHNRNGQLGLGDYEDRFSPTLLPEHQFVDIVAQSRYSICVKSNGTVWSCGYNKYGELGLGDNENRNTFTMIEGFRVSQNNTKSARK